METMGVQIMGAYSYSRCANTNLSIRYFDELRFISNANVYTTMTENKMTSLMIIVGRLNCCTCLILCFQNRYIEILSTKTKQNKQIVPKYLKKDQIFSLQKTKHLMQSCRKFLYVNTVPPSILIFQLLLWQQPCKICPLLLY